MSVFADQSNQPPLDVDLIGSEDARLVFRIGGFECHRRPFLAQPFQRRFFLVDQGDDDVAVVGCVLAADDDDVALVDAGVDHRVALNFERKMFARPEHIWQAGNV